MNRHSNTKPIVSVIITAYNSERFIGEALDSVQSQTFTKWEAIVVDDNSTDETRSIVERYSRDDSRISLIRSHQRSGGPAAGRNRGVAASTAPWIAFLDADDVWHREKLELQLNQTAIRKLKFCCSSMCDFRKKSALVFQPILRTSYSIVNFEKQKRRAQIPISSVMLSRRIALQFPFNENPDYHGVEDYDCWLRILKAGFNCYKLNHELVGYRRSDNQLSKCKLKMLRKVFMAHRAMSKTSFSSALKYSLYHALGGIYFRWYKKKL